MGESNKSTSVVEEISVKRCCGCGKLSVCDVTRAHKIQKDEHCTWKQVSGYVTLEN
jgi:hypothetical protein